MQGDDNFKRFKSVCVPILGSSKLTPSTIPTVSSLLSHLVQLLRETDPIKLNESFISYIFFPLSTILQRNVSAEIPDQILEKILISLSLLSESWWWTCELKAWEQIWMLCGAVVGGIESKGKARARDDETKEAAIQCLVALLHERSPEDAIARGLPVEQPRSRLKQFQDITNSPRFIPIIGQTLDSILGVVLSPRPSLQKRSLELLFYLLNDYAPQSLIPTVFPGVASSMTKVCLGSASKKGWTNGDIVAAALKVLQVAVEKAIGDAICLQEGALPRVEDLEDLASFYRPETSSSDGSEAGSKPFIIPRTQSWLRGTASQLHIALNSLNPLVKHPTPSALYGLVEFSSEIISTTSLTLTQTQPLLISFLLSLSNSEYPNISTRALESLETLLTKSSVRTSLLQSLTQITTDNLASLPRLLSSQSDARVQYAAEMIIAVCRIGLSTNDSAPLSPISKSIGKLLGPSGGIEKWGWSLLSVLELVDPPVTVTHISAAQLMLESNQETHWVPFPDLSFRNVSSHETRHALENMFHALGQAGADSCLFSVEWFFNVGRSGIQSRSVAAMWCACRLLEGVGAIDLASEASLSSSATIRRSKRLEKQSRALARSISELWDRSDFEDLDGDRQNPLQSKNEGEESEIGVQHQKGLVPLHEMLKIVRPQTTKEVRIINQPMLHRSLSLQLIAATAGILQSRFNSLFIFTLYPILHSIVSPTSFLSASGLATLNYVTEATSHASPANLLLSNFDYALDSVSRRLTRRWLDIDATKVLIILIRLVGRDVVDRAGDVVEECFDRLDAFHGYGVIVDGLVEVLTEVLNVIEVEVKSNPLLAPKREEDSLSDSLLRLKGLDQLFDWLPKRHLTPDAEFDEANYGPAPRGAWGDAAQEEDSEPDAKPNESGEPPATPAQALTKQIVSRSLYFLIHESPVIRARILVLLELAVPVLPESALLPSINNAWPFILNRLADHETFVVSAAANLVETLATHLGSFMYRRIWDDVWPRFQTILKQLEVGDLGSALARRTRSAVGTESAYTHSHRLYRSLLNTMTAVMQGVHPHEPSVWESLLLFRRFLGQEVHEELQRCAVQFYLAASKKNSDSVWLVLEPTIEDISPSMRFMRENRWDIDRNAREVLSKLRS